MKITTLSIIVSFVVLFSLLVVPKDYLPVSTPYYILMFYVITFACYCFIYYAPKRLNLKFEQAFFITQLAKMLICIVVLITVIFAHIEKNIKFAFCFVILFVVYQIFEVITLRKLAKEDLKP